MLITYASLMKHNVEEVGICLLKLDVQDVFKVLAGSTLLTNLEDSLVDHWEIFKVVVFYIVQVVCFIIEQNAIDWFENVLTDLLLIIGKLLLNNLNHVFECGLIDFLVKEPERMQVEFVVFIHLFLKELVDSDIEF